MPCYYRVMKHYLIETVFFLGFFAIAGHISMNLWEKYMMQAEINHMKGGLSMLKEAVIDITFAYEHLHDDLKDLLKRRTPSNEEHVKTLHYERPILLDKYTTQVIRNPHTYIETKSPSVIKTEIKREKVEDERKPLTPKVENHSDISMKNINSEVKNNMQLGKMKDSQILRKYQDTWKF